MSLINKLTSDSTLSKKNCENLFTQIFDAIKSSVINRETVLIDNFGLFKVERRKMQTMIDYNRKVVVLLPPKDKIIFEFRNGSTQKEIQSSEKTDFPSKKIIARVSGNTKIDEVSVYEFYNILFEVIREYLEGKRNVNIVEFGKFKINRKNKISFSPAKKFSEKVNYNFNNLKTHIVRSLNKDEIKKLYKEGRQYEEEEDYLHEEAAETITEPIPEVQETISETAVEKEIKPQVTDIKEKEDEYEISGDTTIKENLLMEDFDEQDIELKEKITADFKILEDLFEGKEEVSHITGEKVKEPEYDIRIIQELEEAEQLIEEKEIIKEEKPEDITVVPVPPETKIQEPGPEAVEEELLGDIYEKTVSPDIPEKPAGIIIPGITPEPVETEVKEISEKPSETVTEKPSYTTEKESPITEKIVSDFEEKIKIFRKKEEDDRKSYEQILNKQRIFPEEVSLPKFTEYTKPPVEEVKQVSEPEISFAGTLDKIMKDDEDDIEIPVIKIDEEIIKPEIIPARILQDKESLTTEEPPSKPETAEEVITDAEDIPISQIYKKLRYGFPEESAQKETAEPVETAAPEIEKPVETIAPVAKIPEPPVEILPEKPVIPEETISIKKETDYSVKEDMNFVEGLTYEEKKNKFEDILKKYSENFQPEKITLKIDDDTATEEIQIPTAPVPDKVPDFKTADTPFKPVDESTKVTSSDETLNDIKNFLDEFEKKKSSPESITKKEDESSPFKKIDEDFPKSIDDYFEDIKKYLDKKDLKDSDKEV